MEVHTAEELSVALAAGARIVGVNNRDLHTLEVRVETSLELIAAIPEDCIAVSESGLRSADDLARLSGAGFDAFSDWRAFDARGGSGSGPEPAPPMLKDAFVTRRVRRVITGEESTQARVPVLLEARRQGCFSPRRR